MMGMQFPDRFVEVAAQYVTENVKSVNGFPGLYRSITDDNVRQAFKETAKSDASWSEFCDQISSNNSFPNKKQCDLGLNGMRKTIVKKLSKEVVSKVVKEV